MMASVSWHSGAVEHPRLQVIEKLRWKRKAQELVQERRE